VAIPLTTLAPPSRSSGASVMLGAVLAVVLLAAGGAAAFFFMPKIAPLLGLAPAPPPPVTTAPPADPPVVDPPPVTGGATKDPGAVGTTTATGTTPVEGPRDKDPKVAATTQGQTDQGAGDDGERTQRSVLLTPKLISGVVRRRSSEITECGERHRDELPPDGSVNIELTIKNSGAVREVKIGERSAELMSPGLTRCMHRLLSKLKFPRNHNDPEVTINFPMRFANRDRRERWGGP
jgi:hypothetical protein